MAKNNYIIVVDSATDCNPEYYKNNNIRILSIPYKMNNQIYQHLGYPDISIEMFYYNLKNGINHQVDFITKDIAYITFEEIIKEGKDILCLCLSGTLNKSYSEIKTAAERIKNNYPTNTIEVINTNCISGGEALLLDLCIQRYNKGYSLKSLVDYVSRINDNIVHLFSFNDLTFLKNTNRLQKSSAFLGNIIKLKPLIYLTNNGDIKVYEQVNGINATIKELCQTVKNKYIPNENEEIIISHADCKKDAQKLGDLILKNIPDIKHVRYDKMGPEMCVYGGIGSFGVFFIGKTRFQDTI